MNHTIVYRPYKSSVWFAVFMTGIGLLALMIAGYALPYKGFIVFFLTAIGVVSLWLTKILYDSSNITIYLEQEGLRITGGKHNNYQYISWEELSYTYYIRSFKGHLFLVLSPKTLSSKEAKRLVNQAANLFKIYITGVVVLYIDVLQNTAPLKEFVVQKSKTRDGSPS